MSSGASAPSPRVIALGAASAAAVGLALWLAWPRRPKASLEEVQKALQRMQEECASVFAEMFATVDRAKLPREFFREGRLEGSAESPKNEDEPCSKLQQAIEQPLVLGTPLQRAIDLAAKELPGAWAAEDLEAELARYSEEASVQNSLDDFRRMHSTCLAGGLYQPTLEAKASWEPASILEMLREVGTAKAKCLQDLLAGITEEKQLLRIGAEARRLCEAEEEKIWQRRWPGDRGKRCSFLPLLEHFSSDSSFRQRRFAIETELEELGREAVLTSKAVEREKVG